MARPATGKTLRVLRKGLMAILIVGAMSTHVVATKRTPGKFQNKYIIGASEGAKRVLTTRLV